MPMDRRRRVVLVIAGSLVALAIGVTALVLFLRHAEEDLEQRIAARYPPDAIVLRDMMAVSLGRTSEGVAQIRGNGALVLTRAELHFFQIAPASDLRIPLDRIIGVDIVTSHLGKTMGTDLLRVRFRVDGGADDAIAWSVRPSAETWRAKLPAGGS